jgi:hypothetical protein
MINYRWSSRKPCQIQHSRVDDSGPFVWVNPDDHRAHIVSSPVGNVRRGGHRYYEPGRPLLSHNPAAVSDGTRAMSESHLGSQVGSR